jgi:hypothetical protein
MTSPREITARTFAALDKHLRRASIAQIGGFRPPDDPASSWFGGRFVSLPGEPWPTWQEQEMLSLLQIRVDELPYRPSQLDGVALVTVFVDRDDLPYNTPNGQGWLVRTYPSAAGLVPLPEPGAGSPIRRFPIRWTLCEDEGPDWEDAWRVVDLSEFNALDRSYMDQFHDRYRNHSGTKVGGWPSLIQYELSGVGEFVFQIGSEEKPGWMWGDLGIGYFCLSPNGEWQLVWQCY